MSAGWIAVLCTLVSALGILGLAASDPKRRRGKGRLPRYARTGLTLLTLAPGVWLAATVQGVAFLIWIGASAILGWTVAALASAARQSHQK